MEAISSLLINLADNVDATDVTLLETKILEFLGKDEIVWSIT